MKPSFGVCTLVAVCLASCGGGATSSSPVAMASSPIQGGSDDPTHTFAVGIMQTSDIKNNMVAFCTGVLLAPNLVATARHCVAELSSSTIDCSTSQFGSVLPVTDVFVTTDEVIQPQNMSRFVTVSAIKVPMASNQMDVCGNDIALLILADSITVPEYVVPTITPPMTDSSYEPTVTAIGYGVDTPTDTAGTSAGTRRIKENVALACIPNDPNPDESSLNCFTDPMASTYLTANEFMSGDSTCEGDSGSGAYEQSNFDQGKWVAFGVLSRGGTSSDNQTCIQPIYTRFDAWGPLIIGTAQEAATMGGYAVPWWASSSTSGADASTTASSTPDGGARTEGAAGSSGGQSGDADSDGETTAASGSTDGTPCTGSAQCASGACVSTQASNGYVCASPCGDAGDSCPASFTCRATYCFPGEASPSQGGCSVAAGSSSGRAVPVAFALSGLALAALVGRRRRRSRRRRGHLSVSGHPEGPETPESSGLARAHEIC